MINFDQARSTILESVPRVGAMTVALDRSLNRVLAERVVSAVDVPSFDNAAMDGYAICRSENTMAGTTLAITGEVAAGTTSETALRTGEAIAIMTGAPIPPGCNAVVQQEWTERVDESHVTVLRSVECGHNIRHRGADIKSGATMFDVGTRLRAQEIGALASIGRQYVIVHRPVTVAILTTGNEVVEIGKPLEAGQIYDSNAHTLSALVRELGGEPVVIGIGRDDRQHLRASITRGLQEDVLITTGGVSVGRYDLVREVLEEMGVVIKFWKVNIKPGMPLLFGKFGEKPVFGLPGNPVSTAVTYLQFVRPALRTMMGMKSFSELRMRAKIEHKYAKSDGKRHFVRGIITSEGGEFRVRSTGPQVSNMLSSLTMANCLIVIPEDVEMVKAGDDVDVELL